ncbi:anaerobic ribonucleoside-triphosphate reductase activating protein [Aminipila sp.]|uniref:anaerobic ribonucleoside-triphosphate reductase activating protein n=1 Tax=Aminipila sp. TaxID=2060095 RepID=UPI002899FEC2|nr:anaerobic ribonucleoside-triphosphate reductase activating protein [Aminipila sp.]
MKELKLAGVVKESITDGPGFRFTIFCQGCPHNCQGCHNPGTHDFESGYYVSNDKLIEAIKANPLLSGVTFSGGEPFCQAEAFYHLAEEIKRQLGLNILVYSGYTFEELIKMSKENEYINKLLNICDSLVDGKFILEERDLTLNFRGSRNQRIVDLPQSLISGKAVELEY